MSMKYVSNGNDVVFFSGSEQHRQVANAFLNGDVRSAAFFRVNSECDVVSYGSSISLRLGSSPDDDRIINNAEQLYVYEVKRYSHTEYVFSNSPSLGDVLTTASFDVVDDEPVIVSDNNDVERAAYFMLYDTFPD